MNPQFPIFIPSKGRWEIRRTPRTLDKMNVPYRIIVEEQEYDNYRKYFREDQLIILPKRYKDEYDTFWEKKSNVTGSGASRNFAWDLSIAEGYSHHWVIDDNIECFDRINRNIKARVTSGTIFKCMEDFVLRYDNIAMSGANYSTFVSTRDNVLPFTLNTRIYSCILIRNDIPFRWRGLYNEDTDLTLRVLKEGWCTVLFNAFLAGKITTQRVKGGNTDEIYHNGTLDKSQMLKEMHPDCAEVVWKFNRWHHNVKYNIFNQKLIRRSDINFDKFEKINNYGMKLVTIPKTTKKAPI